MGNEMHNKVLLFGLWLLDSLKPGQPINWWTREWHILLI